MRRAFIYLLLSLSIILSFQHCARVSSPMGGAEDNQPPQLVSSIPEIGQTNYKGQTIILEFNEWVQTQNIESDIIITPRLNTSFKTRVKKNIVELTFFEPFRDSTTFSIGFGSTIEDVTNNNEAKNLNLSFSTGPTIDSLSISGNIKDLISQNPREDAIVSLYSSSDTTNILNGIASYFAITDSSGNYRFNNLPHGQYRIYATNDKNGNNKAESREEKYGFYPDTLDLQSNLSGIDFTVQNLNTEELRRLSARHFGEYFDIEFNKAITEFQLLSPGQFFYRPEGEEKIRFFRGDRTYSDTTDIIYQVKDSIQNVLKDTVSLYFQESRVDKTDITLSTLPGRSNAYPDDTLTLRLSKPIKDYLLDSMYIEIDSTNRISFDPELFQFNQYRTQINTGILLYDYLSTQNPELKIVFKKGALISADNDSTGAQEETYQYTQPSEAAVIKGTVITNKEHVIVQLVNANNRRIIQQTEETNYRFDYVPPGIYYVRVIDDRNNNGRLDVGNLFNNELPEDVKYYFDNYYNTRQIEVRQNWESTADIHF